MIVVLKNHLFQHFFAVMSECRIFSHFIHNTNFRPYYQPQFVTGSIYFRILRIMTDTHKISSHFFQQPHIPTIHFNGNSRSQTCIILMPCSSPQFKILPVQIKACLVHRKPSESNRRNYFLIHFSILGIAYLHFYRI